MDADLQAILLITCLIQPCSLQEDCFMGTGMDTVRLAQCYQIIIGLIIKTVDEYSVEALMCFAFVYRS